MSLSAAYGVALVVGLLSLPSPEQPIGDPIFSLLEILILLMTPLLFVIFALAVLFAAPVFRGDRLATLIRVLLIASGALSLAGLSGVVAGNMRLRNIGIVGYVGVFPLAALLVAVLFRRSRSA